MPNNFGGDQMDPDYNPSTKRRAPKPKQPKPSMKLSSASAAGLKAAVRARKTRHPHPVATRIQLLIEQTSAALNATDAIPTTHSGPTRKLRASNNTIIRNQLSETLENIIPHFQRARHLASQLK